MHIALVLTLDAHGMYGRYCSVDGRKRVLGPPPEHVVDLEQGLRLVVLARDVERPSLVAAREALNFLLISA
jgi:hypothetical protein